MSRDFENGIVASSASGADFISNDIITTGVVHWVDSVNGNDSNAGTEKLPLATIAQAITNATANNGDIVVVKAGSAFSAAAAITLSKAGIKVFGLGSATTKPTITVSGSGVDAIDITAADVEFHNFKFPVGITNTNASRINLGAARPVVKDCTFLCGIKDLHSITITASALGALIDNCTFTVSADGPDEAIIVESASALGLRIENCSFDGGSYGWDNGAIYSAFAHTEFSYSDNTLTSDSSIVHTAAAKGQASGTIAGDGCHVRI